MHYRKSEDFQVPGHDTFSEVFCTPYKPVSRGTKSRLKHPRGVAVKKGRGLEWSRSATPGLLRVGFAAHTTTAKIQLHFKFNEALPTIEKTGRERRELARAVGETPEAYSRLQMACRGQDP